MTIRFSSRTATSCCALCLTGVLALTPVTASARAGADPVTPTTKATDARLLYRSGTQARLRSGAPHLPQDVSALSWLVADAGTGEVLAARNAHRELPPASTLKTLFALTVLPTLPAGLRHKVTDAELAGIGAGSSLVGVAAGRTYRVSDLWRGVFLNSGNDAVHVLAAMNGGWRQTAVRMRSSAAADNTLSVPCSSLNSSTNTRASSTASSARSRSGGTRIGNVDSR
jgi:D-alanyl-D-alanine carboxypeptidase (penicillin-binding protein 5/6)